MTNDNARVKIVSEDVTRIVRVAYEKLTRADIARVFGGDKGAAYQAGYTSFVVLWYRASAIEQEHLLEIMNEYITSQPIHLSRGETI